MNKVRHSTKIAVGFVALAVGAFFGYRFYSNWRVDQFHFAEIKPGKVNIVGVDLGRGFKIVVANQMAQLRQLSAEETMKQGSAGVGGGGGGMEADTGGGKKSRIPIREMLGAMQGNEGELSKFVSILNDLREDKLPPERVYWEAEDVKKALAGDATLKQKLINDLNVQVDGTPLPELRIKSLEDGIVVRAQVPVKVSVAGVRQVLHATILKPFKPRLLQAVEFRYEDKAKADRQMQIGYYIEESRKLIENPKQKEDVARSLRDLLDEKNLAQLADGPERVLQSATVVINESFINKASYKSYNASTGKLSDLTIELTDEGSDRLWKYSKGRVGTQLLLVAEGIAIAAPRISHELSERSLDITQNPDEVLVREAVDLINKHQAGAPTK